jgi:FAD:protein FMN transferase
MASPCEIIVDSSDKQLTKKLTTIASEEALRIQHKFSRYEKDNVLWEINNAQGQEIKVDDETAQLLDFADLSFSLSDGMFDITSGVLRRAWKFDGSDNLPSDARVQECMPYVGWQKVIWQKPYLQLLPDMQLDFGGVGKEYAVDRVLRLLQEKTSNPLLINFGGDLAVSGVRCNGLAWQVGIEKLDEDRQANQILEISAGALATSGDARRYLLRDGIRYSHILNPKTGYPVTHAPRAVTVAGSTCVEAGMLATFALLQGEKAETFLQAQDVTFWCLR